MWNEVQRHVGPTEGKRRTNMTGMSVDDALSRAIVLLASNF
jgi:hypothetical protein